MMTERQLTISPQEFDQACRRTCSDEASRAIRGARLVLILGLSTGRAARAVGCSRQAVHVARCRILDSCQMCPMCGRPKDSIRAPRPLT